jgi:hypothetical protein
MSKLADAVEVTSTTSTLWRQKRSATEREWSDGRRVQFEESIGRPLEQHNDEVIRVVADLDDLLTTAMHDLNA